MKIGREEDHVSRIKIYVWRQRWSRKMERVWTRIREKISKTDPRKNEEEEKKREMTSSQEMHRMPKCYNARVGRYTFEMFVDKRKKLTIPKHTHTNKDPEREGEKAKIIGSSTTRTGLLFFPE